MISDARSVVPTATVRLRNLRDDSETTDAATGDGPIDAAFTCILRITGMNAVLRDRESGRVLWQADAFCEMLTTDTGRIAASMVAPLVRNLGRSAEREAFDIE